MMRAIVLDLRQYLVPGFRETRGTRYIWKLVGSMNLSLGSPH
jgi:hypothetical protein